MEEYESIHLQHRLKLVLLLLGLQGKIFDDMCIYVFFFQAFEIISQSEHKKIQSSLAFALHLCVTNTATED